MFTFGLVELPTSARLLSIFIISNSTIALFFWVRRGEIPECICKHEDYGVGLNNLPLSNVASLLTTRDCLQLTTTYGGFREAWFNLIFWQKSRFFFDVNLRGGREGLPEVVGDTCQHSIKQSWGEGGDIKYSETAQMMLVSCWEKLRCSVPLSPEETDKAGRKALCQALLIRGYA